MDVVNKIAGVSTPNSKVWAFPKCCGVLEYAYSTLQLDCKSSLSCNRKEEWFLEGQLQGSEQIKQENIYAVVPGPVRTGQAVKNVLHAAARENAPSWSLWQTTSGERRGQSLGFWSGGHNRSEAHYTPTEKDILTAYEGPWTVFEVSLWLSANGWMFRGKVPSTHCPLMLHGISQLHPSHN